MTNDKFGRRSIRLKGYDYSAAGGYYVTIVAFRRECLFGDIADGEVRLNALGRIVQECWDEIPSHFPNAEIDAFVVMPNHVHGIIFIYGDGVVGRRMRRPYENAQHIRMVPRLVHWARWWDRSNHRSLAARDAN